MVEMEKAFRAAAKDPQITSVLLSIHPLGMPWAQVEELRDFLKEFKKSGKKVIAHLQLDMAEEREGVRPDAALKPGPASKPGPGSEAAIPPTREAMSWIRALANDWEDERSHSEVGK